MGSDDQIEKGFFDQGLKIFGSYEFEMGEGNLGIVNLI